MTKAGERLIGALQEAIDIMDGKADPATYKVHISDDTDVCAIRLKLGLSQAKFAARYGFSLDTVRKWEQKTRKPSGAALTLLRVIAKHPDIVEAVLAA
jgi:putative transcriptional regulator